MLFRSQGEIEGLKEQLKNSSDIMVNQPKNDNRSCKACGDNIIRDFDKEIPTLREKNSYLITDEGKVKLCFLEKLGKNEEGSILYISDINYCPNCGRKLAEQYGKEDK